MSDAPAVPTLESLFREVRTKSLRVNNLFHRMDGQWQCNLRSADAMTFFEFGYGPDAPGAVMRALEKAGGNKFVPAARKTSDEDLSPNQVGIVRHEGATDQPAPTDEDDEDLVG